MLTDLIARREALVRRSDEQRAQIAQAGAAIGQRLHAVDSVVGVVRRFGKPPAGIAIGAALLWLLGPRRALGWVGRGLTVMSVVRSLQQVVRAGSDTPTPTRQRRFRKR